ncbi:type-F conjugative transfer system pilin assembly protein TrbC (plasmid) [Ralstonia pseudosolanacearum]
MLLAAFARESGAQGTPSTSQLEQEHQRIEAQREQMFDAANPATQPKKGAMPSAVDIDRERRKVERDRKAMFDPENPATKSAANVFPNVPTPERAGIDIEALAKQYEQRAAARKMEDLMIFASFTMPRESLKRLVSQANRVGASVVLRGFKNNSVKETSLAINELGEQTGNVLVNPNAFTKYKVNAVPTFVLAKAATIDQVDNEGCALPDNFAAVSGDVSLDYALDEIVRRVPKFGQVASRYIQQIRGRQ